MAYVIANANKKTFKYTGVQKFHDAGYFGERVVAASGETWNYEKFNNNGLVLDPCNYKEGTEHGSQTIKGFFQVAPKAKVLMLKSTGIFGNKSYESKLMEEGFPQIEKYGVTAMFTSLTSAGSDLYRKDYAKKLKELPNFVPCFAAGNNGEGSVNKMADVDGCIVVGGARLENGKWRYTRSSYSNDELMIDVCGPWSYHISLGEDDPNNSIYMQGTSFAAPYICGMICLINDFFIDKTGKPLTREKMIKFLSDYSQDIEQDGFDKYSGYGVPVLPDPKDIDIWKYAEKEETEPTPSDENDNENNENDDSNPTNPPVPPVDNPLNPPNNADSWAQEWWIKAYNKIGEDGKPICDGTRPKDNISRQEIIVMIGRLGLLD